MTDHCGSGQQRDEPPVEHVGGADCGPRAQVCERAAGGERVEPLQQQLADERVALVDGGEVVAAVPGDDRDEAWQRPRRLRRRQADRVAAVDEAASAGGIRVVMGGRDVKRQPCQLGRAADDVAADRPTRARREVGGVRTGLASR